MIIATAPKTIPGRAYLRIPFLYLIIIAVRALAAPPIDYRVSFDGILDNREYHTPYTDPALRVQPPASQTFFLTRGEMELGFVLDKYHKIRGGVTYTQEFGAPETFDNLNLLFYYHYDNGPKTQFRFGAFPRASALELPKWFFGAEATYRRPFIHGAVVETGVPNIPNLTIGAWIDWVGRQAPDTKELFLFGYNVGFRQGAAFIKHDFMMHHQAHTNPVNPSDFVWDNGGASLEAGVLLNGNAYFDMLLLSAGGIASLDRHRGGYDRYTGITYVDRAPWHTPAGGFLNGEISRSIFVIKGFFYKGGAQRLYWGDDFYSYSGIESYGWLGFGIRFAAKSYIKAESSPKIHFYGGKAAFSQNFTLSAVF